MWKEFKKFVMRGNIINIAVGMVLGVAFGKIVSSFVNDVLMPPIGLLLGGVDFSKLVIVLKKATENSEAVTIRYGVFINTIISFLIIAFVIFLMLKQLERTQKKEEKPAAPPQPPEEILLLREIRDALKAQNQ
jgi:large conductance mechanosensitive channel